MTCIDHSKRTNPLSARFAAAGFIASAVIVLGAFAVPASAADNRDDHRGGDHRDHRDHRGWNRGYSGGYYGAPPVVYGGPYYAPPPVVYGPAVGISLPGISIGVR